MAYPSDFDDLSDDNPTPTSARNSPSLAGRVIALADAVDRTQAELGTTPSGSEDTVRERLEAIEALLATNTPVGTILLTAGSVPSGWLECDGSAVSRATYSDLFAALGTAYGVGDGTTTFNLPDFTNRVPIGDTLGQTAVESNSPDDATSGAPSNNTTSEAANHAHAHSHVHSISHNHGNSNVDYPGHGHSYTKPNSNGSSSVTGGVDTIHRHQIPALSQNSGAASPSSTSNGGAHTHTMSNHTHEHSHVHEVNAVGVVFMIKA